MVAFRPAHLIYFNNFPIFGLKKFKLMDGVFFKKLLLSFKRKFLLKVYKKLVVKHHFQTFFTKVPFKDKFADSKHYRNFLLKDRDFRTAFLNNRNLRRAYLGGDLPSFFRHKVCHKLFENKSFREKFFNDIFFRNKFLRKKMFRADAIKFAFSNKNLSRADLFYDP